MPETHPTFASEVQRGIARAAVDLVDDFDAADVIAALTADRIGSASGYSASTVRYQLGLGSGDEKSPARWTHDRKRLLELMALEVADRLLRTTEESVERYLAGLQTLRRTGDLSAFASAMAADVDGFTPGASAADVGGRAERAQLLLFAASDKVRPAARALRDGLNLQMEAYQRAVDLAMAILKRRLRDDADRLVVVKQIHLLLDGVSIERRLDPAFDITPVVRSLLAIFLAWTVPIESSDEPAPEAVILRGLEHHSAAAPGSS